MKNSRGFTLIELLVVIAIIGILSSVVLASLSSARNKGKDAAVKSALGSIRTQMEIDANGSNYGTAAYVAGAGSNVGCGVGNFNAATILPIKANLVTNLAANTQFSCSVDAAAAASAAPAQKWAVAAILPSSAGAKTFCVDSSGNTAERTAATSGTIAATEVNNGACVNQ